LNSCERLSKTLHQHQYKQNIEVVHNYVDEIETNQENKENRNYQVPCCEIGNILNRKNIHFLYNYL